MIKKHNQGFTLIELLVVIAIIGMLSSIVLASLQSARFRGANGAIKSNLNNARAQAELFYDSNNNKYYGGAAATDVCNTSGLVNGIRGIYAHLDAARTAGSVSNAINTSSLIAGGLLTVTCHSSSGAWAAEAPLAPINTGQGMWCVDSNGSSKQEPASFGLGNSCAP